MPTFREVVCERMGWAKEAYTWNVFRQSLYGHAVLPASLIHFLSPQFFQPDFHVIDRVGSATTSLEFDKALQDFHTYNVRHQNTFRCRWGFRVSGRKLGRFHSEVCGQPLASEHTAYFTRSEE